MEALQEEVLVLTNRVVHVIHSVCNAYGASANKNEGNAFLVSWRLPAMNMITCRCALDWTGTQSNTKSTGRNKSL